MTTLQSCQAKEQLLVGQDGAALLVILYVELIYALPINILLS